MNYMHISNPLLSVVLQQGYIFNQVYHIFKFHLAEFILEDTHWEMLRQRYVSDMFAIMGKQIFFSYHPMCSKTMHVSKQEQNRWRGASWLDQQHFSKCSVYRYRLTAGERTPASDYVLFISQVTFYILWCSLVIFYCCTE